MKLSIPEPCHENWSEMSPTQKGRFCGSCQKEVTDFTEMTKVEIKEFFINKASESTCGRFENKQIESFNRPEIQPKRINTKPWWIAAATFFLFANRGLSQGQIISQHPKPKQVKADTIKRKTTVAMEAPKLVVADPGDDVAVLDTIKKDSLVFIRGQVLDTNGDTISFANILIQGTGIGTTTNLEGKFELLVPKKHQDSLTLVVSFIGYRSINYSFNNLTKTVDSLEIKMVEASCNIKGYIIMGGPRLIEDPTQPKTINDSGVLRRLFRFR